VNPWWWVLIGLAAWFLVAILAGLLIGPVLRRSSQARESSSQLPEETSAEHGPPQDERQAS
jgi:Kef-type K+ transport system membrane component KefB